MAGDDDDDRDGGGGGDDGGGGGGGCSGCRWMPETGADRPALKEADIGDACCHGDDRDGGGGGGWCRCLPEAGADHRRHRRWRQRLPLP